MASRRACDGYQIWTRRARFRCGLSSGQSYRPRSIRDGKLGFQFLAPLAFQNAISKNGVIAKGPLACRNVAARRLIERSPSVIETGKAQEPFKENGYRSIPALLKCALDG